MPCGGWTQDLFQLLQTVRDTRGNPHRQFLCSEDAADSFLPAKADDSPRCSSKRTGSNKSKPSRKRSEEHTSELQSRLHLVCRLLLEKKTTMTETAMTAPASRA